MVYAVQQVIFLLAITTLATPHGSTPAQSNISHSVATPASIASNISASHSPQASSDGVCDSRTVNYITHVLPHQCLKEERIQASSISNAPHNDNITTSIFNEAITTITNSILPAATSTRPVASDIPNNTTTTPHTSQNDETSQPHAETQTVAPESASADTPQRIVESDELDEESPLDTVHFLSFEEWKKQNLAKAGQSPEHVGHRPELSTSGSPRPAINNVLESMGDEGEIDLNFGFGDVKHRQNDGPANDISTTERNVVDTPYASSSSVRSKDAGKTCKERTNYASFDCAATVLKNNPEGRSASSVLVEHKDSYMLNKCSAKNKFIILELCDDILVDTVVLANYEFFSSIFRHFRVSVSDRYPAKADKWKDLGTFEAHNTRGIQAFLIENPLIWARYLRIEFLSHYGNEYYCPISLLRVHGTTMMEEYKHQDEISRGEIGYEDNLEVETTQATLDHSSTHSESLNHIQAAQTNVKDEQAVQRTEVVRDEKQIVPKSMIEPLAASELRLDISQTASPNRSNSSSGSPASSTENITSSSISITAEVVDSKNNVKSEAMSSNPHSTNHVGTDSENTPPPIAEPSNNVNSQTATPVTVPPANITSNQKVEANTKKSSSIPISAKSAPAISSSVESGGRTFNDSTKPSTQTHTIASLHTFAPNTTKVSTSSSTLNSQPQPSTQESFFKSVHKRLQQLESNSTLSLQYIEEQSRILRDAFSKVEKRQSSNAVAFLAHLNATVMLELVSYRQAYDQLWQSTVLELESHREQYQLEMLALSSRLTIVADELLWQKRVGIFQSTLLLLALGLVLFARQNGTSEVPIFQQVVNRSQAAFRTGWESEPSSPPRVMRVSKARSVNGFGSPVSDNDNFSDESVSNSHQSRDFSLHVSPPTPDSVTESTSDHDSDSIERNESLVEADLKSNNVPSPA